MQSRPSNYKLKNLLARSLFKTYWLKWPEYRIVCPYLSKFHGDSSHVSGLNHRSKNLDGVSSLVFVACSLWETASDVVGDVAYTNFRSESQKSQLIQTC